MIRELEIVESFEHEGLCPVNPNDETLELQNQQQRQMNHQEQFEDIGTLEENKRIVWRKPCSAQQARAKRGARASFYFQTRAKRNLCFCAAAP